MTRLRSAVGPAHIFPGAGASSEETPVAAAAVTAEVSLPSAGWSPSMKKAELLARALEKGLSVSAASTKAEIVSALESASDS